MIRRKKLSKKAQLIALLQRNDGATLDQIVEATGWQAHTCRAALTGLRKSGYAVGSAMTDEGRCYRITAVAEDAQ